jgi:hypothetical protein
VLVARTKRSPIWSSKSLRCLLALLVIAAFYSEILAEAFLERSTIRSAQSLADGTLLERVLRSASWTVKRSKPVLSRNGVEPVAL